MKGERQILSEYQKHLLVEVLETAVEVTLQPLKNVL